MLIFKKKDEFSADWSTNRHIKMSPFKENGKCKKSME